MQGTLAETHDGLSLSMTKKNGDSNFNQPGFMRENISTTFLPWEISSLLVGRMQRWLLRCSMKPSIDLVPVAGQGTLL